MHLQLRRQLQQCSRRGQLTAAAGAGTTAAGLWAGGGDRSCYHRLNYRSRGALITQAAAVL
jgi:hypothetical protein